MGNMNDTQRSANVCTKQQRIAQIAREHPKEKLTALNHYLDIPWLEEAFQRLRKDSAPGVDGQTVAKYEKHLESNLKDLLSRAKDGSYQAPPVKRVHIPKGDDPKETRPIGIPTTENKVLERGVVMILEPIYEEEFRNFSYGFRPGRSCHQALSAFWNQASGMGVQWVLEVDIRKYFDSVVWSNLMEIVGKRIGDGVSAPWKGAELQWESNKPTRQLTLQPVAAEANMEAMKCFEALGAKGPEVGQRANRS